MTDETHAPPGPVPSAGHEQRDISVRPVVLAGTGLLVVTLIVFVAMRFLFVFYEHREERLSPPANPLAVEYGPALPPQPRLQSHPIRDLVELRATEEAILHSYAWVDVQAGVVRIPIGRAMELLAENPPASRAATERKE